MCWVYIEINKETQYDMSIKWLLVRKNESTCFSHIASIRSTPMAQRRVYFIQQRKIFTIFWLWLMFFFSCLSEMFFSALFWLLDACFGYFASVPLKFIYALVFYELFISLVHFGNHINIIDCLYILKFCLSKTELINWAYFCCFMFKRGHFFFLL